MAATSRQFDFDGVRRRGDGADTRADLADVDTRIAVQRKNTRNALEHALLDAGQRTAGHGFFCRLEDDAHRSAQGGFLVHGVQHQRNAKHARGVDVMPARVGDAMVLRRERKPGLLDDGEGVDVSAQAVAMGPSPTSTVSPEPSSRRGSSPAASSRSTSLSVVRNSLKESSGCACRSLRNSRSSGKRSSSHGFTTGVGSVSVVKLRTSQL